jgi:hypothetical protein
MITSQIKKKARTKETVKLQGPDSQLVEKVNNIHYYHVNFS